MTAPPRRPSTADLDRLLDEAVATFYGAQVEHAHLMQHLAVRHGLNPVDLRALQFLGAVDDDRTPKELGGYLEMGTGAVTALLDRLTRQGLLDRVRNPDDRRSVRIELTLDGVAVLGSVRAAYRQVLEGAVAPESFELFIDFTGRMADALRAAARPDDPDV
ncbi:MarR family winged helix-turn-helix transcriptional regulator [Curtobacterium sp. MCPF17_050]|uniref:MarR family winged helix-turn-helix transcriptional regulator n=1 Tax=unclassified Curtobacterium TaxID=257496 RepID=UPI0021AD27E8|nr:MULTISPECIES: MarR family winged helix-turn-helix transcriptional regulator [unclassified Curtobacterium]WIB15793.1 MarR family winged helix-turn-helix transcriptional regulator [Curtobacterium sp. MCPF17_050]